MPRIIALTDKNIPKVLCIWSLPLFYIILRLIKVLKVYLLISSFHFFPCVQVSFTQSLIDLTVMMKSQSRVQYTDLVIFKQPVIFFKKLNAVSLLSFKND